MFELQGLHVIVNVSHALDFVLSRNKEVCLHVDINRNCLHTFAAAGMLKTE